MKILIIIPTYNEKQNITRLVSKIYKCKKDLDVLVIDDNSPDGTGNAADEFSKKNRKVKVMHRKTKQGIGSAYVQGFRYALKKKYDLIFQMDADFSHDPKYISGFVKASENFDMVIGSRWIKGGGIVGWPWFRYVVSLTANLIARLFLGLKPLDITSGYRCYRRAVLEKVNLKDIVSAGYAFTAEAIYRVQKKGFTIGEVPIVFVDRKYGETKLSKTEVYTSAIALVKLFFAKRVFGWLSK